MTNTETPATSPVDEKFTRKSSQHVRLERFHHVGSDVVRVIVDRDSYSAQSFANVAVLSTDRKWTLLASIGGQELAEMVGSPYGDDRGLELDMRGPALALIRRAITILSV